LRLLSGLNLQSNGQEATDSDHQKRREYLFDEHGGNCSMPCADTLQDMAEAARADVNLLSNQHACACCDELFTLKNLSSHSIEDKPGELWVPLCADEASTDMNETLRAQYDLTSYSDSAHEGWKDLFLSPLSIFDDDGCASIRVCNKCSSSLATAAVPKLAIRNHLWIGAFTCIHSC
jgi:hypothetical protein